MGNSEVVTSNIPNRERNVQSVERTHHYLCL